MRDAKAASASYLSASSCDFYGCPTAPGPGDWGCRGRVSLEIHFAAFHEKLSPVAKSFGLKLVADGHANADLSGKETLGGLGRLPLLSALLSPQLRSLSGKREPLLGRMTSPQKKG